MRSLLVLAALVALASVPWLTASDFDDEREVASPKSEAAQRPTVTAPEEEPGASPYALLPSPPVRDASDFGLKRSLLWR